MMIRADASSDYHGDRILGYVADAVVDPVDKPTRGRPGRQATAACRASSASLSPPAYMGRHSHLPRASPANLVQQFEESYNRPKVHPHPTGTKHGYCHG